MSTNTKRKFRSAPGRLLDYEIDLCRFFQHLDMSTSQIIEALAVSTEDESLGGHDDLKVQLLRETADKLKKIEAVEDNEPVDFVLNPEIFGDNT